MQSYIQSCHPPAEQTANLLGFDDEPSGPPAGYGAVPTNNNDLLGLGDDMFGSSQPTQSASKPVTNTDSYDPFADFLGGSSAPTAPKPASRENSFTNDFFGQATTNHNAKPANTTADLLGFDMPAPTQPQSNQNTAAFDPFASWTSGTTSTQPVKPVQSTPAAQQPKSKPNNDLFDPLGTFDLNGMSFSNQPNKTPLNQTKSNFSATNTNKPTLAQQYSNQPYNNQFSNPNRQNSSNPPPAATNKPITNNNATSQKPAAKKTGLGLDDLLANNDFGFTKTPQKVDKSIGAKFKKARDEALGDPVQAKIINWTENKENNIRALLSSLQEVLWENEDRWKKVTIGRGFGEKLSKKRKIFQSRIYFGIWLGEFLFSYGRHADSNPSQKSVSKSLPDRSSRPSVRKTL